MSGLSRHNNKSFVFHKKHAVNFSKAAPRAQSRADDVGVVFKMSVGIRWKKRLSPLVILGQNIMILRGQFSTKKRAVSILKVAP
jgi:hypothetical protein